MITAAPSTALATIPPAFTDPERLAPAGFLAGYRGLTREAYALDLRQFTTWCRARSLPLPLFAAPTSKASPGNSRSGAGPALPSPGAFVHHRRILQARRRRGTPGPLPCRPRPPSAGGLRVACCCPLDRNELGALLVAAGLGPPTEHALISLLALNGCASRKLPAPTSTRYGMPSSPAVGRHGRPWRIPNEHSVASASRVRQRLAVCQEQSTWLGRDISRPSPRRLP